MCFIWKLVAMKHHGEIIERAVRGGAYPVTTLARKLGVTRQTVYNIFTAPVVSWDRILAIGAIINYDFSKDIKSLKTKVYSTQADTDLIFKDSVEEVAYWKNRYILLLEKYNELLLKSKQ